MFKAVRRVALLTAMFASSLAFAAEQSRHLSVKIHNHTKQAQQFAVQTNPLLANKLTKAKPTPSKTINSEKDMVVIGFDKNGKELSRQVISNPLYFRAEVFDQHDGSIVFAKDVKRDSALLNIRVPEHKELHSIAIYEVEKHLGEFTLKQLQSLSLDNIASSTKKSIVSESAASQAEGVFKIVDNGDSNNRVDLVFLSEGYTQSELPNFSGDVERIVEGFFRESPFLEYISLFNVWRVEAASQVSGAGTNGQPINTRFGANFGCYNIERLLCVDENKVLTYINSVLESQEADQVIVVVNSQTYGGAGGQVATMSLADAAIDIAVHEIGHTLGKLADEYDYGTCNSAEPSEANVTTNSNGAKWSHWNNVASNVGAYEGARYCSSGMYRPTENSMMRSLGQPFYEVNTEELIVRFYGYVDGIDSFAPSQTNLSVEGEQTFTVTTVEASPSTTEVTWFVNNEQVATGKSFTLSSNDYQDGAYTIRARVKDTTDAVIRDTNNVTETSQSWQVQLTGSTSCNIGAPSQLSASNVQQTSFDLDWSAASNASSYEVQVNESGSWRTKLTTERTNAALSGFAQGRQVEVRVNAISNCGSNASTAITVQLQSDQQCNLGEPGAITASNITDRSFTVTWGAAANASSYNVQVLDDGVWRTQATTSSTSADLSGFEAGSNVQVRVQAVSDCGETLTSVFTVTLLTDPACDLGTAERLSASNVNSTSFSLTWNAAENAQNYKVQTLENGIWRTKTTTTNTNANLTGFAEGRDVEVRVVAVASCGETISATIVVNLIKDTTCDLGTAERLSASNVNTNSFSLSWNAAANAQNYKVQVFENGTWRTKVTTSNTNANLSGFTAGSDVQVRVVAVADCGETESASLTVTLEDEPAQCEPAVPTNLAFQDYFSYYATGSWTASEGATSYSVQAWNGYNWQEITTTSSTDTGWFYSYGYQYFRVSASNSCGSSEYSDYVKATAY
ncbi:M64 family metallopeptidase [Thalassotalea ganghwensis]